MQIYVGNLSGGITADDLRAAFTPLGRVTRAVIVLDGRSGHSKGFGFVFMPNHDHAQLAVAALNTSLLNGRALQVNEMLPLTPHVSHQVMA